jgi:hypothetical protein
MTDVVRHRLEVQTEKELCTCCIERDFCFAHFRDCCRCRSFVNYCDALELEWKEKTHGELE